mmetsp:Transcript_5219/g.4803  ORF Transcript_5219/g.4803 Transcript_5219/m.4803 type:complete len:114 (+) Transcript_5219:517-858(+)
MFYKDKLHKMEEIIVARTLMYLTKWSDEFRDKPFNVMQETSLIVADCLNACVFGLKNCDDQLLYEDEDGTFRSVKIHEFMKLISAKQFKRTFRPLHMLFEAFDSLYIGHAERV